MQLQTLKILRKQQRRRWSQCEEASEQGRPCKSCVEEARLENGCRFEKQKQDQILKREARPKSENERGRKRKKKLNESCGGCHCHDDGGGVRPRCFRQRPQQQNKDLVFVFNQHH